MMGSVEKVKEILIEEVQKVPAIWDKGHRNHHNRYHLEKQWKKISQDVGIADSRARKTWKNLRQEFGKQMTKALKADCTLENLHSEWPFFQQLMFLRDQFTNKKPNDELILPVKYEDYDELCRMDDSTSRRSNTDVAEGIDIPTPSPAGSSRESSPSLSSGPSVESYTMSQPKQKSSSRYHSRKRKRRDESFSIGSNNDEDVGFFNSLLPYVRRLAPQQKLLFRLKLQQYLYDLSYCYISDRQFMPFETNNSSSMALYPTQGSIYQSSQRNSPSANTNNIASSKHNINEELLRDSPQIMSSPKDNS